MYYSRKPICSSYGMVRLEKGLHHATWTKSYPCFSCTDIMKPRHSCRPRTCWAKHCKPPSEPCIVIGIQPLNYRKNGWPFASWNSQSFPNPMLLSQMPISVNWTNALIMTDWHTALVEIVAGMTLASILTLPKPWLEFESTFKRKMTEICYQREWRLLAYFWPH